MSLAGKRRRLSPGQLRRPLLRTCVALRAVEEAGGTPRVHLLGSISFMGRGVPSEIQPNVARRTTISICLHQRSCV